MIDEFPPEPLAEKPELPQEEDVIDGELFFDVSTPTSGGAYFGGASPAVRPIKSAQLEVGGQGLPGGGIWKVADKPRSGLDDGGKS